MSSPDPTDTTPADRATPPGRAGRWGGLVPLTAAGTGVVLVAVSAVLLLHNRGLPADFGTVPDTDGQRVAPAAAAAAPPGPASSVDVAPVRSTTVPPSTAQAAAGTVPGRAAPTSASSRPPTSSPATASSRRMPAAPSATTTAAHRTAPAPDDSELPRQLVLPRFGVRADVLPVTSDNGSLTVPENPRQVGWWVGSVLPGSGSGTTVIDGHIDSATAGVGAFIHLSDLVPGDSVSIVGGTGRTLEYDVVARRVYPKNAGLPPSLFDAGGPERLLLISCGGPFDATRGSYEDNIVVFATPSAH